MENQSDTEGPSANTTEKLPEHLHKLLYWLANEDIYISDYVRAWQKRTPREEAADTLARVARYAKPEPHSLLYSALRGAKMLLVTSDSVSENGPAGRKAGLRAAIMLANWNDARCLAPLVRVYETHWMWKGRYQDAVHKALLRFLSAEPRPEEAREHSEAILRLADRLWKTSSFRSDLPEPLTDLLLAALPWLLVAGGPKDLSMLNSISNASGKAPNRRRVKEAATVLLGHANN